MHNTTNTTNATNTTNNSIFEYWSRLYRDWYLLVVLVLLVVFNGILAPRASAFNMSNDSYILQMGDFNMVSGEPTGTNYTLNLTVGELAPGLYSGANFKVRSGFQYISSIIKFQFIISGTEVNFGTLDPTSPVTRTQTLTVNNGSGNGYVVLASENHALQSGTDTIPDTTCDGGTCNEINSSAWSGILTYGFGYRCDNLNGSDCSTDFNTPNTYKQFANTALSEIPQAVMIGKNVGKNKQATITYKANVSATQPNGTYSNQITYIAVPTF